MPILCQRPHKMKRKKALPTVILHFYTFSTHDLFFMHQYTSQQKNCSLRGTSVNTSSHQCKPDDVSLVFQNTRGGCCVHVCKEAHWRIHMTGEHCRHRRHRKCEKCPHLLNNPQPKPVVMSRFLLFWPEKARLPHRYQKDGMKKYGDEETLSCVRKVKTPLLWTLLKSRHNLHAWKHQIQTAISEVPRESATDLYWWDKESSRRDQSWQPILTKFSMVIQIPVLKMEKTISQFW